MNKKLLIIGLALSSLMSFAAPLAMAQTPPAVNINNSGFHLVICDGPALPASLNTPAGYVPCDFKGLMMQARYLINVMIVLGVVAAIVGFAYAGYNYILGTQESRNTAKSIFPKVFWGFIIMLVSWFVVYQILQWLTGNAGAYLMTK